MRTRTISRPETGVLIGWQLKPKKVEARLETFPPFFMLLAYGPDGNPARYPEITPIQAEEFALCQRCGLRFAPQRVQNYTPYLFQYQTDDRGRFTLSAPAPLQISRLRSRTASLAWLSVDFRIAPGKRGPVYAALADAMPWAVPVPLTELVLTFSDAVESDQPELFDWETHIKWT